MRTSSAWSFMTGTPKRNGTCCWFPRKRQVLQISFCDGGFTVILKEVGCFYCIIFVFESAVNVSIRAHQREVALIGCRMCLLPSYLVNGFCPIGREMHRFDGQQREVFASKCTGLWCIDFEVTYLFIFFSIGGGQGTSGATLTTPSPPPPPQGRVPEGCVRRYSLEATAARRASQISPASRFFFFFCHLFNTTETAVVKYTVQIFANQKEKMPFCLVTSRLIVANFWSKSKNFGTFGFL